MLNHENRFLFHFAGKSIKRNAGRSFFIGLSVSLAVIIAVWILAFFDGVNRQIERSVVNTNIGYFQVQEKEFARTTDPSAPLVFDGQMEEAFAADEIAPSPELVLDANITAPEGSAALLVLGIVPKLHEKFLGVSSNLIGGEFLNSTGENEIVIGEALAKEFKYKVGDDFVLNYQDKKGQLRSELVKVKGIFNFSSHSFEKRYAYVNQSTWQKLYLNEDTGRTLFNRVSLMVPDLEWKETILKNLPKSDLVLKSWRDLNPEMSVVMDFNDGMVRMFFLIIAITVLMTILTPVQMLWQERFRELKMLNTLGVSNSRFWKIGLFEVLHMIFYSGIVSSIILVIIIGIQSKTGVVFDYGKEGINIERAGIQLTGIVYPVLAPGQISVTFLFIIFVLVVSYLWSIHRTLGKLEADK